MKRADMKNRVTIRDVAAAANVSVATVSYVLNGKKKVSEETRQKILAVIDELGFVPDLNARGSFNLKVGFTFSVLSTLRVHAKWLIFNIVL